MFSLKIIQNCLFKLYLVTKSGFVVVAQYAWIQNRGIASSKVFFCFQYLKNLELDTLTLRMRVLVLRVLVQMTRHVVYSTHRF